MKGILADSNVQGQVRILTYLLESEEWKDVWTALNIPIRLFSDLSLADDAPDMDIWYACQREGIALLTNNRNAAGPDSLEETIRLHNTPQSLPVFTFSDAEKIRHSREYAAQVVERLLEYLLDIDAYRGTGRLYLP